jgi:hypothetical protein
MPLFRKDKAKDEEDIDALLADGENAGMFMTTSVQQEADAGGAEEPADADGEQGPAVNIVTPEAAPAAAEQPPEAGAPAEETPAGDDPLSLFRSMQVVTDSSGLTSDMEDVPVEELLAELRELQSMLPQQTPGGAE